MVWGAGGGIGRALVSSLKKDGWRVLAMGRHTADLEDLTPHTFEVDVTQPSSIEQALAAASQETNQVGLWIYAVGDIAASKVADVSPQDWQRILEANLTGAYLTAHYSLPLLARDGHLQVLRRAADAVLCL